jgi:hypothetical protein
MGKSFEFDRPLRRSLNCSTRSNPLYIASDKCGVVYDPGGVRIEGVRDVVRSDQRRVAWRCV